MKIHFTNLFGQSPQSVALMAQNDIMNVVRELGVNELGIYFYDHSSEPASELNSRMDGILVGVLLGILSSFNHLLGMELSGIAVWLIS